MRYDKIIPIKLVANSTDELGNVIEECVKLEPIMCRFTAWTAEDITLYGRECAKTSKKVIVKTGDFKEDFERFIIADKEFNFKVLQKGNRWTVIEVLAWK